MASTVVELMRRRFGEKNETWQEVTLNYTDGDSFVLMGETFTYDSTNHVYVSSNYIYPNEIIITLDPNITTTLNSFLVITGGDNRQNEIWQGATTLIYTNVRFDNQVVRNLRTTNSLSEIRLIADDSSVWLNGSELGNYLGTMKFKYFNGRDGSYHTDCNKVLSIKVR